ncbi:hypothetical protein L4C31_01375 [Aliivibrio sifiae]
MRKKTLLILLTVISPYSNATGLIPKIADAESLQHSFLAHQKHRYSQCMNVAPQTKREECKKIQEETELIRSKIWSDVHSKEPSSSD